MDNRKFQVLSWVIMITILVTVMVQGYWNWRNYEESKKHLVSEVQISLDNAVEQYYTQLAKVHFVKIDQNQSIWNEKVVRSFPDSGTQDSVIRRTYKLRTRTPELHEVKLNIDSLIGTHQTNMVVVSKFNDTDSFALGERRFIKLASKLAMSLEADSLDYGRLDSLVEEELKRKDVDVVFDLKRNGITDLSPEVVAIYANSAYFPPGTEVALTIEPSFLAVLKRGMSGVIVSLLTAAVIVFVLMYLYRFIQHQKSLDLMKNDLISNITHEFKTPIATVSTALEAIEKFNTEQDFAKTSKYLKLSNIQLTKLNEMVEKLLETATLEENELILNREKVNLNEMIREVIDRYESIDGKHIAWHEGSPVSVQIDAFHFEHVVSNLIDNAIKYGGNEIEIELALEEDLISLSVTDNGKGIAKNELSRIFDKFYRISQGNLHDVKGYGIGLYYAKVIVEKHGGQLTATSKNGETTFKITMKV
ncbi:ATP-binding protein [Reichenbachiella sp.]|uniref:sensor histidine kinase n=1 Tax=Reichenbachiella sp. TaxID=2184521 RepID=UPI0032981BD0